MLPAAEREPIDLSERGLIELRLDDGTPPLAELLATHDVTIATVEVAALHAPVVVVSPRRRSDGPVALYIHGGGGLFGTPFTGIAPVLEWVDMFGMTVVSVEYRLAPEHPHPAALDDCLEAWAWVADTFGAHQALIAGMSAGAGLAASVAQRVRDQGLPAAIGVVLMYPSLDDRGGSTSARQFESGPVWNTTANAQSWRYRRGSREHVSSLSAARATRLDGLPATYIDVGSAEVFRDEAVAYALRLWAEGGRAELHVWEGGYHCFDDLAPEAAVSRAARASRNQWVARILRQESR